MEKEEKKEKSISLIEEEKEDIKDDFKAEE